MSASPLTVIEPPRRSLAALLEERGQLPLAEVARIAEGVGRELQRTHDRAEVFGVLRPDTVHVTADTVELESRAGGGIDYASPEQLSEAELDARTDLWGLGAVLYRALVGRPPFKAEDDASLKIAILQRAFPRATSLVSDLPVEIDAFFTKALRKDKVERFQSVDEMVGALRGLASSEGGVVARSGSYGADPPAPKPPERAMESTKVEPEPPAPEKSAEQPASEPPAEPPAEGDAAQRSGLFRTMIALACVAFVGLLVYVNVDAIRALFDDWTAPGTTPGERRLAKAQSLPRVTLPTPDGGEKTLPLDKPFIMNVWLEGCPDCIPCFERWRDLSQAGQIPPLPVVNVAYGRTDPDVAAHYSVDEGLVTDADGKSVVMPLDIGKFTTFIVAPDGKILFRAVPTEKDFASRLAEAAKP